MRNSLFALFLLVAPFAAWASGGEGPELEHADIDLTDQASLQRGAKYFVNYCMGCHTLKYARYNRVAADIGITEAQLEEFLIFGDARSGELMTNSLRPEDGEKWFGTAIPDLTLVTRWRSPDWLFTYLKSYYVDDSRPYGVNNLVFPDVGMPHALADLQGVQEAVHADGGHDGGGHITGLKLVEPGTLTPEEYDNMARDITNFLTYVGEPIKLERRRLGVYVLLFLAVLGYLSYLLKKEYWKDVH
ncbi:cytochrome c1 [Thiorhodovibrio frisius]|uniref:Cytochrome c1 n=1 Tax=Thiorhodovibrio frisius TaxID=631362 RepID=H8Z5T8_9GAMM|nr:cytochrome c1 [Thiorhodovibrio frisius]EIC19572.1 cytochrome c1 [Thiorhodovibrio frisius]WPL20466.1 Cytochrome b/c1 [Thiorhodovibrio frisius]